MPTDHDAQNARIIKFIEKLRGSEAAETAANDLKNGETTHVLQLLNNIDTKLFPNQVLELLDQGPDGIAKLRQQCEEQVAIQEELSSLQGMLQDRFKDVFAGNARG